MYENVYMSGLKQKAAGEAAKAKQLTEAEKEYQKAISVGSDKVIPSLRQRHEKKGLGFLASSAEILSKNPVNGMNEVNRIFYQTKEGLNNLIEQSDEVRKRTTPGYSDKFLVPTKLMAALNSNRDLEEAYNDPATGLKEEEAIYNYKLDFNPENGAVAISFNDIPKQDVVKDYYNWQKNTVYESDADLGDLFTLGRAKRQEIERVVTPEASENLLTTLSGNRVVATNWWNLGYDITTKEGRDKVYRDYLAPRVDAFTSGGGFNISIGPGSLSSKEATISPLYSSADASYGWSVFSIPDKPGRFQLKTKEGLIAKNEDGENMEFANSQDAINWKNKNSKKTLSGEALQVGYEASSLVPKDGFYIGEETSRTKFGERVSGNTVNAKVTRIETIPIYTGTETKQYGLFVLKPGDPVLKEVLDIDPNIKNEKRLFVVAEGGKVVGSGGKETTIGATMYLPATKANLGAVLKGIPTSDKALRGQIEKIIKGEKLGGAGVLGAATKGAEVQPKSGFNLFNFA